MKSINVSVPLTHPLLRTWPATQACALTGDRTGDPLVCRLVLNPLSHTSQGEWHVFNPGTLGSPGPKDRAPARSVLGSHVAGGPGAQRTGSVAAG